METLYKKFEKRRILTSVSIAWIFNYCQVECATERSMYRDLLWKQEHLQTKDFSIQFHPHSRSEKTTIEVTSLWNFAIAPEKTTRSDSPTN